MQGNRVPRTSLNGPLNGPLNGSLNGSSSPAGIAFGSSSTPSSRLSPKHTGRTIICCFDGTGNKFGENSNVIRFFRALKKDEPEKQLVYYQPGIGTYNKRQFVTRTFTKFVSMVDQALALHLNDHVKDGYRFVMQNYREGDKICLFGFSRGAHTARVVAGMLYKVGILPPHNQEQLDFAFSVYQTPGDKGYALSKEFKRTFAMPVTVEFVGVWDTVSSVGIIPRAHRYTSVNYAVKTFRHALALDERRARFRPNTWNEPTDDREQDLDVDEPRLEPRAGISRDDWVYEPPNRDVADVEEVWFTGCHADIGGGSHHDKIKDSLSYIPLRWMIKECFTTRTGILFDHDYLITMGFDLLKLAEQLTQLGINVEELGLGHAALKRLNEERKTRSLWQEEQVPVEVPQTPVARTQSLMRTRTDSFTPTHLSALNTRLFVAIQHARDRIDGLAYIWDQLAINRFWWLLEFIPMLTTYQESNGDWVYTRVRNLGQGRYIPFDGDVVKVHESVKERIDTTRGSQEAYQPVAHNWDTLVDLRMIKFVA